MVVSSSTSNRFKTAHREANHEIDNSSNPTRLFQLVVDKEFEDAIVRSKENPSEASKWILRKDGQQGISWRRLPLHEACIRQPEESLVDALIEAYPTGVQEADHNGRLPLHHACFYGAKKEVVHKLLMAYPESVEVADVWGKTPLCVATGSSNKVDNTVLEALSKPAVHYLVLRQKKDWIAEAEKKMVAVGESFKAEIETYKGKIAKLEKQANVDRATIKAIKEECKVKVEEREKELAQARSELTNLRNDVNSLEELQKKLQDSTDANTALEERLKTFESEAKAASNLFEEKLKAAESEAKTDRNKVVAFEQLASDLEESKRTVSELKKQIEATTAKAESQEAKFQNTMASKTVLEEEVEFLNKKLEESEYNQTKLKEEVESVKQEDSDLRAKLAAALSVRVELESKVSQLQESVENAEEMKSEIDSLKKEVDSKSALESKLEELDAKYSQSEEALAAARSSAENEKTTLEAKVLSLEQTVSELNEANEKLREKESANAETIAQIGKSAADAYLHSSESIAHYESKLEEAHLKLNTIAAENQEEKAKMAAKVDSLESTIRTLISKRAEEQKQAYDSFNELERALNHAAEERARMMETLIQQKKSLNGELDVELSDPTESLQDKREPNEELSLPPSASDDE